MQDQTSLISCICVTKNSPHLLKRAIDCFESQTYPNKELVILYESNNRATASLLLSYLNKKEIILLEVKPAADKRLGYLRNQAITAANGEYICQWDDDDWYHTERLSTQYNSIKDTLYAASVLSRWLMFDNVNKNAYISFSRMWEGSLLCRKETMLRKTYKNVSMGEDTDVIQQLHLKKLIYPIETPKLYIYNYHGGNTFPLVHFNRFFKSSLQLSQMQSEEIDTLLQNTPIQGSLYLDKLFSSLVIHKKSRL